MGFWKLSPFLAVGILVLWQVGSLQAAPFRSALESSSDSTVLNEEEARLLLATLVKDFVQLKTRELAHETEDSRPERAPFPTPPPVHPELGAETTP
nr:calcitonin receptor-stimulating peptide 1-like isoform X2 [Loxodonta africana]